MSKRLNIVDMPRDPERALGGLRHSICAVFNYCRSYPRKMATLKSVLKYTHGRIVAWEKEEAVRVEREAKAVIEIAAEAIGFAVDSRQTIENMEASLAAAQKEYDAAQAQQTVGE